MSEGLVKAGLMTKKGAKRKNWKLRIFQLDEDMLTYSVPKTRKQKGYIRISEIESVFKAEPPPKKEKFKNHHALHIVVPGRVYECLATESDERDSWIEEITKLLGSKGGEGEPKAKSETATLRTMKSIMELLKASKNVTIATFDGEGNPRVRYTEVDFNEEMEIRFSASKDSKKVEEIMANPDVHVSLGYSGIQMEKASAYAQLEAVAYVSSLKHEKTALWKDSFKEYFSGPDDPNYVVVVMIPVRVEYIPKVGAPSEEWDSPLADSLKKKAMLYKLVNKYQFGTLATLTEGGVASRYIKALSQGFDNLIFSLERDSAKHKEIMADSRIHYVLGFTAVAMDKAKNYAQVEGEVLIKDDLEEKKRYWDKSMGGSFSGPEDDKYLIGMIKISAFEYKMDFAGEALAWKREDNKNVGVEVGEQMKAQGENIVEIESEKGKEEERSDLIEQKEEKQGVWVEEYQNDDKEENTAKKKDEIMLMEENVSEIQTEGKFRLEVQELNEHIEKDEDESIVVIDDRDQGNETTVTEVSGSGGEDDLLNQVLALLEKQSLCAASTISPNGGVRVKYLKANINEKLELRFSTMKSSKQYRELVEDHNIHITAGYSGIGMDEAGPYIQYAGIGSISEDQEEKKANWNSEDEKIFSGPDDPNYVVCIVQPIRIEYVDRPGLDVKTLEFERSRKLGRDGEYLALRESICECLGENDFAVATTITEEGRAKVRYVMVNSNERMEIRFATLKNSGKYKELLENPEIHLTLGYTGEAMSNSTAFLQIQGKVEFTETKEERQAISNEMLGNIFEDPEDPNYVICIVKPYRIEFTEMIGESTQVLDLY